MLRISAEGAATALVLTVQARTGRAADAGFLQTALTLPYVLSGPVIGHLLDRAARPRVPALLLAAGYAVATVVLFLVAGRSPLILALMVAAVVGCTEPIVVALTSMLPRFVPAERLTRAYGLEASSYSVAAIAGPGLAAAIAAYAGGSLSGAAIVAAAGAGAVVLALLRLPGPGNEPERTGLRDVVVGGLHVLAANRVLRALTVATTFGWLGFGGVAVTAVLFAEHIGADASAGGRLLVAFAVGSLIGSLASSRWLKARFAERVVFGGLVAFGGSVALVCLAPSLPWALACFLLVGIVEGPVFTATLMLRQRESPPDRLGQVNTTGGSLKIGGSAVGAALTGVFADEIGPVGLLLAIAACQLIGALAGLLTLFSRTGRGWV
ncbi:MFS transporter [Spirillospora sp. NPDC029432]|uniref:MFS transporter n=1 Tax=Spirillospora sp. NPDC029432 TaxID=3154599 RepID=UPI003452F16A